MDESYVVVFPSVFSRGRIPQLVSNIRSILRIRDQRFGSVRRDGDVILVEANDPVFASSAICLLFGIDRVAIARRTENDYARIVSEIVSVGGNLLLKGERFLVRVEGAARGFVPKDVEIAATSGIIESRSELGARPGTDGDHDKLLYTYLTRKSAYVCIFTDAGNGGVPYESQQRRAACAVYDGVSAISCYETIRQGYDARILVCYRRDSELLGLAKMLNRLVPRLVRGEIGLDFFRLDVASGAKNYPAYVRSVLGILLEQPEPYVSLAIPPQSFPAEFVEDAMRKTFGSGKVPVMPLAGADMFADAGEIGLGRDMKKLERILSARYAGVPDPPAGAVAGALKTRKSITFRVGPNNVHDILDSLG